MLCSVSCEWSDMWMFQPRWGTSICPLSPSHPNKIGTCCYYCNSILSLAQQMYLSDPFGNVGKAFGCKLVDAGELHSWSAEFVNQSKTRSFRATSHQTEPWVMFQRAYIMMEIQWSLINPRKQSQLYIHNFDVKIHGNTGSNKNPCEIRNFKECSYIFSRFVLGHRVSY
jgi:hypothetical protein